MAQRAMIHQQPAEERGQVAIQGAPLFHPRRADGIVPAPPVMGLGPQCPPAGQGRDDLRVIRQQPQALHLGPRVRGTRRRRCRTSQPRQ